MRIDQLKNPKKISKRGYFLIAEYADRIDFNDKGNQITVLLTLIGAN